MACHSGGSNVSPAALNIFSEYAKTGHPVPSGNNLHDAAETVLLNNNRHATCVDCHNPHAATQPSVNLNGVDCWTYFEIALGFARMLELKTGNYTPQDLLAMIELDRYRGGQCNGRYTSRLHYLEDWIDDNERRGSGPSRWNLPLHSSTRRSWNSGTGAGRRSRKCAKSYTRQTLRLSKSGSGSTRNRQGLPSFPAAASSARERRTRTWSR